MSNIFIEEIKKEEDWDFIIRNSKQSTVFSETFFLKSTGKKYLRLVFKKGSEIKAGICFFLSDDKKKIINYYLGIYGGLLFINDTKSKTFRKNFDQFNITEKLVDYLTNNFDSIKFKTHPSFQDLRPFQWYNYGNSSPKFLINIKYTSVLEGNNLNQIKSGFSSNHIRSITKSTEKKYITEISNNSDELFKLFGDLVKKNKINITDKEIDEIEKTCVSLLSKNKAIIINVKNKKTTLASVLYTWDNETSYFLLGARNVKVHSVDASTYCHWSMIEHLFKNFNLRKFDLEGVNSPKRGLFKLKFGGNLFTYYDIEFIK